MDSHEPLLDRKVLDENTMKSVPLQEELFTLFFEQGELYLTQLEAALSNGNAEDWHMTAHGVKGASRSLGMIRLATLAATAERDGPDGARLAAIRDTMRDTFTTIYPDRREDAA